MSQPPETDLSTAAARTVADAVQAPPPRMTDDPERYIEWLRTRPAVEASQRPRTPRRYLDRAKIPRKWGLGGERPAQLSPHPAPGSVPERPDGYDTAVAILQRLADFGAASLEAARTEHPDWDYGDLVIHAAAHPVTPPAAPDDDTTTDRPTAITPVCEDCGTVLDPDRTCWTCTNPTAREAS